MEGYNKGAIRIIGRTPFAAGYFGTSIRTIWNPQRNRAPRIPPVTDFQWSSGHRDAKHSSLSRQTVVTALR